MVEVGEEGMFDFFFVGDGRSYTVVWVGGVCWEINLSDARGGFGWKGCF